MIVILYSFNRVHCKKQSREKTKPEKRRNEMNVNNNSLSQWSVSRSWVLSDYRWICKDRGEHCIKHNDLQINDEKIYVELLSFVVKRKQTMVDYRIVFEVTRRISNIRIIKQSKKQRENKILDCASLVYWYKKKIISIHIAYCY